MTPGAIRPHPTPKALSVGRAQVLPSDADASPTDVHILQLAAQTSPQDAHDSTDHAAAFERVHAHASTDHATAFERVRTLPAVERAQAPTDVECAQTPAISALSASSNTVLDHPTSLADYSPKSTHLTTVISQPEMSSLDSSLGGAPYVATDEVSEHQGYYPDPPAAPTPDASLGGAPYEATAKTSAHQGADLVSASAPTYPHDKYDVIFCGGYFNGYHNIDNRATYILPLAMCARGIRGTTCVDGADAVEQWDPPSPCPWRVKKRKRPGSPNHWSDETSSWPMRKIKIFDQVLPPVEYEPDNKPSTY